MKFYKLGKLTTLSLLFITIIIVLSLLGNICPDKIQNYIYIKTSSIKLVYDHIFLVFVSCFVSAFTGMGTGILFTRKICKSFMPGISALASAAQTFPPIAVLALSVPILGFGIKPALAALIIYSFFPVLRSTVAGIESVPQEIVESARGMGMREHQILLKIEIPLSAGVIVSGIRVAAIIGTGTAALGSTVGAGGLGLPILSGFMNENYFYVLHGGILAGFLAILTDLYLEKIASIMT